MISVSTSLRWLRHGLLAIVLGLSPLGAGAQDAKKEAGAAKPAAGDRTWYAKSIARGEGGMLIVDYWSKGDRFRAETVVAGHTIVTIVNASYYYTLDPVGGRGIRIERSERAIAQDAERDRPFANELDKLLQDGGERVGSDPVVGRDYDHYRITDGSGKREVWVTPGEQKIPVQVKTFHRESAMTDVLNYAGWMVGIGIADSFFEPDPRIEIEPVGYAEYMERSRKGPVGPAPVLYKHLLHGISD